MTMEFGRAHAVNKDDIQLDKHMLRTSTLAHFQINLLSQIETELSSLCITNKVVCSRAA